MSVDDKDTSPILLVLQEGKFKLSEISISDVNIIDSEDDSFTEMQYNYTINKLYINGVEKTIEDDLEEYDNDTAAFLKEIEEVINDLVNRAISRMLEEYTKNVVAELDNLGIK